MEEKINKRTSHQIDLSGTSYGIVKVIRLINPGYRILADQRYECLCQCGNTIVSSRSTIISSRTYSCGCYALQQAKEKNTSHGDSRSGKNHKGKRLYRIWEGMRRRCSSKCDNKSYHLYYGRGIRVCEEWQEYDVFKEWALSNGYNDKLSIDRIDSSGNYEPSNCRWATSHEQLLNTSRNVKVMYNGKEYLMYNLAQELGIDYRIFYERLRRGKSVEDIVKNKDKRGVELVSKKVKKYSKDGDFICEYNSVSDAGRDVCGKPSVGNILKAISGKISHAYGYKWSY